MKQADLDALRAKAESRWATELFDPADIRALFAELDACEEERDAALAMLKASGIDLGASADEKTRA